MDTLKLFMAIPGKVNFLQMGRYGEFSEQTYSNNFENEAFDWFAFNEHLFRKALNGKVDFANLDLSRCEEIEVDKGRLIGLKAYSKSLKRSIKVVVWYPNEEDTTKWQIYFSSNDSMSTKDVIDCYRTRFQLEFCSEMRNTMPVLTTASQPTSEH